MISMSDAEKDGAVWEALTVVPKGHHCWYDDKHGEDGHWPVVTLVLLSRGTFSRPCSSLLRLLPLPDGRWLLLRYFLERSA